ncbi:MAG: UDP-4-amino-4,6-dideoxy-N-acetyl-beta-L-altrosamine transaminase [Pseudomonadota bacterium]
MTTIPYGKQHISQQDVDEVVRCLESDFLTQGPRIPKFEDDVANYCGATHAVAVNSATSALHIACLALDVGPGDQVWTSAITFVASANAALYCGASVDFVDIDNESINMCPAQLEHKLIEAEQHGKLPKVVIPVHMCGHPCDMARIGELAERFGFKIIEDASHAVGASYGAARVGSCEHSDIAVFSFHPVKIITTGEGGMALTNNESLAEKMRLFRSHGVTREPGLLEHDENDGWYYEQLELGFNYRMTDLAAALGSSQMLCLDEFVAARRTLADRYIDQLADMPLSWPTEIESAASSYHLFVVMIDADDRRRRRDVFNQMRSRGIHVNVHYIPVYKQPYYQRFGFSKDYCPNAEQYYSRCLTLPLYPDLSIQDQDTVITALTSALGS